MRLRRTGKRGNKVRSRNTRKRQTLRRKFRGGTSNEPYAARPEFRYDGRVQAWNNTLRYDVYENFIKNMEKMIDNQHKMIDLLEAIKKGQNSSDSTQNEINNV